MYTKQGITTLVAFVASASLVMPMHAIDHVRLLLPPSLDKAKMALWVPSLQDTMVFHRSNPPSVEIPLTFFRQAQHNLAMEAGHASMTVERWCAWINEALRLAQVRVQVVEVLDPTTQAPIDAKTQRTKGVLQTCYVVLAPYAAGYATWYLAACVVGCLGLLLVYYVRVAHEETEAAQHANA